LLTEGLVETLGRGVRIGVKGGTELDPLFGGVWGGVLGGDAPDKKRKEKFSGNREERGERTL